MKCITASIGTPTEQTTELRVRVETRERAPKPHTRVLTDVFPPGTWRTDERTRNKLTAEYQYLRAAAGYCRMCPNKRTHYKHRCDVCQAKERERWRVKQAAYNAARGPTLRTVVKRSRRSKFRFAAVKWLRLRRERAKH